MAPEPSAMSSLESILARRFPAVAVGFMAVQVVALESSAIFSVVLAVRPGMVVPSKREILSGCAARCLNTETGWSTNGMRSSIIEDRLVCSKI
ncbi:hypothetical protein BDA96_07G215300 [Sorghum bicolor]|uniref:Uncharacterized protein n=2 Tax=Sorghum bicolor TaxID=4558 RepID=A0A1Z5RBQ5_SORBI|nr:hypothetical protein BDA96_07G215300 [Sorghum bicolor]OQU80875.1 hypothetical protein SORBI_3007G202420 [Sorghum bicolor]